MLTAAKLREELERLIDINQYGAINDLLNRTLRDNLPLILSALEKAERLDRIEARGVSNPELEMDE